MNASVDVLATVMLAAAIDNERCVTFLRRR
jgi:hypothetical protein